MSIDCLDNIRCDCLECANAIKDHICCIKKTDLDTKLISELLIDNFSIDNVWDGLDYSTKYKNIKEIYKTRYKKCEKFNIDSDLISCLW